MDWSQSHIVKVGIDYINESRTVRLNVRQGHLTVLQLSKLIAHLRKAQHSDLEMTYQENQRLKRELDALIKRRGITLDRGQYIAIRHVRSIVQGYIDSITPDDAMEMFGHDEDEDAQDAPQAAGAASSSSVVPVPIAAVPAHAPAQAVVTYANDVVAQRAHQIAQFQDYSREDIIDELIQKEEQIVKLISEKQHWKTRAGNLLKKCNHVENQLVTIQAEHDQLVEKTNFRPGLRNISHYGGYSAALKSVTGYASSEATCQMVLADTHVGGFTEKNVVTRFQHRAATAQRIRSKHISEQLRQDLDAPAQVQSQIVTASGVRSFECTSCSVYGISCDASNSEAIERSSIHVALASVATLGRDHIRVCVSHHGELDEDSLEKATGSSRQLCDIQKVTLKTGDELYCMLLRELGSISFDDWEQIANNAHLRPHHHSTFTFSLDKGPDCQKVLRLIKQRLKGIPNHSVLGVFCFQHRTDHCNQSHLGLLNKWDWEVLDEVSHIKYTSSLAIFTNTWRGIGIPTKLQDTSAAIFGDRVSVKCFSSRPGRLVRTRWLSADDIEAKVRLCQEYSGRVFSEVFREEMAKHAQAQAKAQAKAQAAKAAAKPKPTPSASNNQVGHAREPEEEDFSIKQHRWRVSSTLLSNSRRWYGTVNISIETKEEFNHCIK